jgi:hypothetical protein
MEDRRCTGLTRLGAQCRRNSNAGSDRCGLHQEGDQCSICMTNMLPRSSRQLPCSHTFHVRCIDRWKRSSRTCPMCREPFDQPLYNVTITIQCTADGQSATETYTTSNIQGIIHSFGISQNMLNDMGRRTVTDINFDIEFNEILEEVLRELGVTSFRVPGSNTVNTA